MVKFVFLYVFFCLMVNCCAKTEKICFTQNGEFGTCKLISDCPVLLNILIESNTEEEKKFLKDSFCEWVPAGPSVCCSTRKITFPETAVETRSPINKKNLFPSMTTCGFQDKDKILGGMSTDITEFPWTALLVYNDRVNTSSFQCGGVLINDRYILTAAHCQTNELSRVRLGEWNLKTAADCKGKGLSSLCTKHIDVEIESIRIHKQYKLDRIIGLFNDIALIRLKEPVNFTSFIQPICLPRIEKDVVGKELWVTGWGVTNVTNQVVSDIKQKVKMHVLSQSECTKKFRNRKYHAEVNDSHLCAEGKNEKRTCIGDSGNGFVTTVNDQEPQFYVEGIVSYGGQFCTNVPVVFTRVYPFLEWIESNVEP